MQFEQSLSAVRGIAVVASLVALPACHLSKPSTTPVIDSSSVAARQAIATERSNDPRSFPLRSVAAPPWAIRTTDTTLIPLAYGLAELVATDLAMSRQVVVVERLRLDAILRELRLADAGGIDSASAPRLGRIIGARRLVVGVIDDRGNGELGIRVRLANAVDATFAGNISARAPLASIFDAEKALVFRVFDQLGVTLTPQERAAIEQRPTANVTALLAYSRGVRDEAFGRPAAAALNYRNALAADPGFSVVRSRLQRIESGLRTSDTRSTGNSKTGPSASSKAQVTTSAVASALAGGAVNPSPLAFLGGQSATSIVQQTSQQDRATQGQSQVIANILIIIKQLP